MTDAMRNLEGLFAQAEQAARSGDTQAAVATFTYILSLAPEHPRALNGLGNRAVASGDPGGARDFFRRALKADPRATAIWLNLALAERALENAPGELAALDAALAIDPYFMIALLQKAQWFERHDRRGEAVLVYRSLLDAAPALDTLPAGIREALQHGKTLVDASDAGIERAIRDEIGERAHGRVRFDHALEVLGGRRKVFLPKPAGLHYPYLPALQYFDRAQFPWFEKLEAATGAIREEVLALGRGEDLNRPYVSIAPGTPENQWRDLNNSLDWGAIFVWKDGAPVDDVVRRCPATAALLRDLPLLDIPGRGPTAMFSTLKPHTRIPPHHGVTNIRSVVHLPLTVPAGCAFRVGSETREWHEGVAWAFDDTIEHEAWNPTDETRVILIIDVWNPFLDEEERSLLRSANHVLARLDAGHLTAN